MANVHLTLAVGEYDHVRDLLDGTVRIEGVDLTVLRLPVEEIFYRFLHNTEWDISETSFGKVLSLVSQNDPRLVVIPVFTSRIFRHSSIYLRSDSGITRPEQLSGKRIGVPEWAQTASIYSRGMLMHEYGVDLKSIKWFQGGVNQAGRDEKVKLKLPEGISLTPVPDRSLSEMLLAGDLDVILSARPPAPFMAGDKRIRRLFEDHKTVELAYWKKTGIFPIMHVVTLRRESYEKNRWIAMNVMKAFEEAKNRSLHRLSFFDAHPVYPVPWMPENTAISREMFGPDFWPYGIEGSRKTLEAFTQYAFEQGVCHRKLSVEEIFVPETLKSYRV